MRICYIWFCHIWLPQTSASLKRGMHDRAETDLPCSFQKPSFVCCVTQLVYQLQGWDLPSSECELDSNGTDFPWPLPTNPPISISFHFLAQKSASRDHCDCNGSIFPRSSLSPAGGLYFVFNLSFTDIWRWKCCDLSRPKLKLASHASDHEQCCQSSI